MKYCVPNGTQTERLKKFSTNMMSLSGQKLNEDIFKEWESFLHPTPPVTKLVDIFENEMSREEIQMKLKLADKKHFLQFYLQPAIEQEIIEMTIPDKPNSRLQKYRLTEKGIKRKLENIK